jgi:hypothetical protein
MDAAAHIILQTTEAEVIPGGTARYPFVVRTGGRLPPAAEFGVSSDDLRFDPRWARVVRATDELGVTQYLLEVTPDDVGRSQYGRHQLHIRWVGNAEAWCLLVIKPGVRLTAEPDLITWPSGELKLSIENFGRVGVDVEINLRHHGSSWSRGWEFGLETGVGPVTITEEFQPPQGGGGGTFSLTVSAAGIPLIQGQLVGQTRAVSRRGVPRKVVVTVALLLAGAAVGTALVLAGTGQDTNVTPVPSPTVQTQSPAPPTTTQPPPPPPVTPTTPTSPTSTSPTTPVTTPGTTPATTPSFIVP